MLAPAVIVVHDAALLGRLAIMRVIGGALITVATSIALSGLAKAEEMTGAAIKELIRGKTVYMELTAASVAAVDRGIIYYAPNGTALYNTAMGDMWHGTWTIKDDTACLTWKEAPGERCTRYDKQGDVISMINVATGKPRGRVVMTAPGNIENLAP